MKSFLFLLGFSLLVSTAPAQTFTVLYSFTGGIDGGDPAVGLTKDSAGNFYGTTNAGGDLTCRAPYGCGAVFKLGPSGGLTILKSFHQPTTSSDLTLDSLGNLYGVTTGEGLSKLGDVYKLDPSGAETVLFSFSGEGLPEAGVVLDRAGNIYGTTVSGGANNNYGSVYKVSASGSITFLHIFNQSDGYFPLGDLIRDPAGSLYGTTIYGGANSEGTVFKVDQSGNFTLLHSFSQGPDAEPPARVIRDAAGNLYGVTQGSYALTNRCISHGGCGSIFKLDPAGNETVLYTFTGGADGTFPLGALVRDSVGNLYGTTSRGGANDKGTIFEIKANGQFRVLYSFKGGVDGFRPKGRLVRDSAGNLYGTSEFGGDLQQGCIYRLSPN